MNYSIISRQYRIGIMVAGLIICLNGCSSKHSFIKHQQVRILVFSYTKGYAHASIKAGVAAVQKLGAAHNIRVDTTKNPAWFVRDTLKRYQAIVFLNTTGDVLNDAQQMAFQQYIRAGGGYMGIHSATDTEKQWPWYSGLAGAIFDSHPAQQKAIVNVVDKSNPATDFLPDHWERSDEWYNFREIRPDLHILLALDESSYKGGKNGTNHPIAWYHSYDGGRAFYTGGGHTDESYQEPLFLKHLLAGINYAAGLTK